MPFLGRTDVEVATAIMKPGHVGRLESRQSAESAVGSDC